MTISLDAKIRLNGSTFCRFLCFSFYFTNQVSTLEKLNLSQTIDVIPPVMHLLGFVLSQMMLFIVSLRYFVCFKRRCILFSF
jgi:hypothetical protein